MDSTGSSAQKLLQVAGAWLGGCALAAFAVRSVNDPLWADELLTTHLLQADSLPRLWSGIARGIDGNPPLYLTGAWLLTRLLPSAVPIVAALKLLNIAWVGLGLVALWRLARRALSAVSCTAGALILVTLNDNLLYAAFELRTYATYFATAAVAALCQQRLIERGRPADLMLSALSFVGLAFAHTFGIAYVGCIALAGCLSRPRDGALLRRALLATGPAVLLLLAWTPVLREQLQVASPYGWMTEPGWSELAETLFSSQWLLAISVVALLGLGNAGMAWLKRTPRRLEEMVASDQGQPARYLGLLAAGFTAFALAGWMVSRAAVPIFVPRFFTPQIVVSYLLLTAFAQWLLVAAPRALALPAALLIGGLMLRNVVDHAATPFHGDPVCADANGGYFESPHVGGDLPVIADSPHVFLPRAAYAAHAAAYRFPLDWDVVMTYPTRSPGNAVDYHILQALQGWLPMPQIVSTADVVRDGAQFLVIETPGRAWFDHLRATHKVQAEALAHSVGRAGVVCTLWKVTAVDAPR